MRAKRSGLRSTSTRSCCISNVSYSLTVKPTLRSDGSTTRSTRARSTPARATISLTRSSRPRLRIGEVDRVDRVLRDRNGDRRTRHHLVVVVGHHRGLALALQRLALAVELDEIHRRIGARAIGDAVAHAGADEGQVRIAVARLDDLLLVAELAAQVHLIVTVFAALREERVERAEELRHQVVAVMEAHRQALIEIAGSGVERRVERAAMAAQQVAGSSRCGG